MVYSLFTVPIMWNTRKRVKQGETSLYNLSSEGWKSLWAMKILGVVNKFLLKALNNILPTVKIYSIDMSLTIHYVLFVKGRRKLLLMPYGAVLLQVMCGLKIPAL